MKLRWKALILGFIVMLVSAGVYLIFFQQSVTPGVAGDIETEEGPEVPEELVTQNLVAFAKLYGFIKYFHPSDEVADFDWEGFASYGANQVRNAEDTEALMTQLETLFQPVAPTLILTTDQSFDPNKTDIANLLQKNQGQYIFWQHRGITTDFTTAIYRSSEDVYQSDRVIFEMENEEAVLDDPVFEMVPAEEEYLAEKQLTDDITAFFPVVLPYGEEGSLGTTDESKDAFKALKDEVIAAKFGGTSVQSVHGRLAGVIQTWNIYQHFYPYFDVVDVNWEEQLPVFLSLAEEEQGHEDYTAVLEDMIEKAQDGHSMVISRKSSYGDTLPIRVHVIKDEVIVVEALEDSPFKAGDIVLKKDGTAAKELMKNLMDKTSGSPQYKEALAERMFVIGDSHTVIEVNRDGEIMELSAENGSSYLDSTLKVHEPVVELEDGIYYLPLYQNVPEEKYAEYYEELASAKALILDLRYYPSSSAIELFGHLVKEPLPTSQFLIPQYVLPDQEGEITYEDGSWELEPKEPVFDGEMIFLSDGLAISYAETLLGIAENNELGTIVGQPSAGTNGNVNGFKLMEHITIYYTGMKVLKGDGSQHHLIGIQPDVPVNYTLESVKNGKDDFIEKALEVLEEKLGDHE
ncbi:S41 family peptidase [Jeotgalibacillus salarius]|uniref:Tail specific protease domain-containing protein n=1 Tax=Jeotgalibacillus salarius TaxID=546023 RepID=A0A4Y8LD31_9BACL|nr:S41 family peptidase [Jeotgalibacillus salarius]TFE00538.1 hypothetical protein E2626_11205 [Jeotgalibacillus salarius]